MGVVVRNVDTGEVSEEHPSVTDKLIPLTADAYLLKGNFNHKQLEDFRKSWYALCERTDRRMTVILAPESMELTPLPGEKFSFEVALRLMKLGHKVKRENWEGYIYIQGGNIYHEGNIPLFLQNGDILGLDWQLADEKAG